jgi:hypothetical protein
LAQFARGDSSYVPHQNHVTPRVCAGKQAGMPAGAVIANQSQRRTALAPQHRGTNPGTKCSSGIRGTPLIGEQRTILVQTQGTGMEVPAGTRNRSQLSQSGCRQRRRRSQEQEERKRSQPPSSSCAAVCHVPCLERGRGRGRGRGRERERGRDATPSRPGSTFHFTFFTSTART